MANVTFCCWLFTFHNNLPYAEFPIFKNKKIFYLVKVVSECLARYSLCTLLIVQWVHVIDCAVITDSTKQKLLKISKKWQPNPISDKFLNCQLQDIKSQLSMKNSKSLKFSMDFQSSGKKHFNFKGLKLLFLITKHQLRLKTYQKRIKRLARSNSKPNINYGKSAENQQIAKNFNQRQETKKPWKKLFSTKGKQSAENIDKKTEKTWNCTRRVDSKSKRRIQEAAASQPIDNPTTIYREATNQRSLHTKSTTKDLLKDSNKRITSATGKHHEDSTEATAEWIAKILDDSTTNWHGNFFFNSTSTFTHQRPQQLNSSTKETKTQRISWWSATRRKIDDFTVEKTKIWWEIKTFSRKIFERKLRKLVEFSDEELQVPWQLRHISVFCCCKTIVGARLLQLTRLFQSSFVMINSTLCLTINATNFTVISFNFVFTWAFFYSTGKKTLSSLNFVCWTNDDLPVINFSFFIILETWNAWKFLQAEDFTEWHLFTAVLKARSLIVLSAKASENKRQSNDASEFLFKTERVWCVCRMFQCWKNIECRTLINARSANEVLLKRMRWK